MPMNDQCLPHGRLNLTFHWVLTVHITRYPTLEQTWKLTRRVARHRNDASRLEPDLPFVERSDANSNFDGGHGDWVGDLLLSKTKEASLYRKNIHILLLAFEGSFSIYNDETTLSCNLTVKFVHD